MIFRKTNLDFFKNWVGKYGRTVLASVTTDSTAGVLSNMKAIHQANRTLCYHCVYCLAARNRTKVVPAIAASTQGCGVQAKLRMQREAKASLKFPHARIWHWCRRSVSRLRPHAAEIVAADEKPLMQKLSLRLFFCLRFRAVWRRLPRAHAGLSHFCATLAPQSHLADSLIPPGHRLRRVNVPALLDTLWSKKFKEFL